MAEVWEEGVGLGLCEAPTRPDAAPKGASAAARDDAVDLLCSGSGLRFARWRRARLEVDEVLDGTSAQLVPGAALTPAMPHAFHVWSRRTAPRGRSHCPSPPRAGARGHACRGW